MPFNISTFLSNIDKGSIAKPYNFEVTIYRPEQRGVVSQNIPPISGTGNINLPLPTLSGNIAILPSRSLMFRTDTIDTPGRRIQTADVMYYGIKRYFGYESQMNELGLTIYLSKNLEEKVFIEEWQDIIVGNHRTGAQTQTMFDLGFYDDYAKGKIEITQFNEKAEPTHLHTVIDAFPVAVNSLSQSWTDEAPLKLLVTFAYRYYNNKVIVKDKG